MNYQYLCLGMKKKTVVLKVYLSSIIRKKERYTKLIEQTNQQQTI